MMADSPLITPRGKSSKSKRCLPTIPNDLRRRENIQTSPGLKSVKFNTETIETSIGGTQTTGKIKPSVPESSSFSTDESSLSTNNSVDNSLSPNGGFLDNGTSSTSENSSDSSSVNDNSSVTVQVSVESDVYKENYLTPVKGTSGNFRTAFDHLDLDNITSPGMRTPRRRYTLDDKLLQTPECYSTVQMESPRTRLGRIVNELGMDGEDSSSVTVAVRVRPYSQRELCDADVRCIVSMYGNETTVLSDNGTKHRFTYDFSFWSFDDRHGEFASQEHVYLMLAQPLLGKAFEGYNTCLFAYGQTGSGKSYSIMGHGNEVGIVPRFCEELFSRAEVTRDSDKVKISVEISFFEIYNEKIHDLLASSKKAGEKKPTLRVREHPVLGPYVEGLSTFVVNSFEDIEGWITLGNKNRATAATGMNDKSSRSHSVFTLVLTQTRTEEIDGQEHDHAITSKINLVDLAGSERQSQAQTSGERLREGANINKSLMSLGKVISQLSDQSITIGKKKKAFIPYRDSVLTWLLKESLGGNSKTAMIATISPAHHHTEETLSTLRYAKQARNIVNTARVNEDPKARIIRELKAEIERLRDQQGGMNGDTHLANLEEIASLRDQLLSKEREMDEIKRSWQERLKKAEERKMQEAKQLEKAGISFKVDNKLPNLVNLNEDPQLSDLLLYVIKEGQTRVGRMCPDSKHEIQLSGALIADDHCIINNVESVVNITPIGDAPTYVNGDMVLEPTILHHGDRVILGGDHYFRFNHPMEVKNKTSQASQEMKDFEYAKQELLNAQESRLQAELEEAREEARRQAEEEKLREIEKAKREAEIELNMQKTGYEGKLLELEQVLKTQLEEVQQAQQSRQEAEDAIQKLKKQKMMLEQEVIAGRKRQQLEANAAKKAASSVVCERSPLVELLEMEKKREATRLEELKQRRTEIMSPFKRPLTDNTTIRKTDLYKVELLLREANKISQFLKKNTTFSRLDYMENEKVKTVIKVTNNKLGVCTNWTVPKFEEKLIQMRDLYQNETEGSADDEVFNDPEDNWEQDQKALSPFIKSPKSRHGPRRSFQSPINRSSVMSSISSLDDSYRVGVCCCRIKTCQSMSSTCKNFVVDILESIKEGKMEVTLGDKILESCDRMKRVVTMVLDLCCNEDSVSSSLENNTEILHTNCISLVTSYHSLASDSSLWTTTLLEDNQHSSFLQDLTKKFQDLTKSVGSQIVLFFQGCENSIDSLVQESCENLRNNLLDLCKVVGELAIATDTCIKSIEQSTEDSTKVNSSSDVCMSFLNGCDVFIDKSLQGGIKSLEDWKSKAQSYISNTADKLNLGEIPVKVEFVVNSAIDLLSNCQELQVEVNSSMRESIDSLPSEYYSINYRRSQGLVNQVSDLVEKTGLLMQHTQPVLEGEDGDLRKISRCAEMIQKSAIQLLVSSNTDKNKSRPLSDSIDQSDCSVLSTVQMEQLEHAARELKTGAQSLIEQVDKVMSYDRQVSTPRGRRLLPASPDRAAASPISRGVTIKRL